MTAVGGLLAGQRTGIHKYFYTLTDHGLALEPRLTGSDPVEVRAVEAAFAEDALPSTREERLQTLVEQLAAEVAALEDATVRREALECGAAEIRVADRDSIEREDALHGLGLRVCLVRLRQPPRAD